jgi:SpoVK/Ycf46/Vps4 family AAA+-type ATPase
MDLHEEMYHLARLSLVGRQQDIGLFLRRLCQRARAGDSAALAERIEKLLAESPTRSSPIRNAERVGLPHDADSRLDLLRVESPVHLDREPVWSPEVGGHLQQIVAERRAESDLLKQGLSPTRTALLTGLPGVGKTLAARWLARELGRPLLTLDLSAVMSSLLGRTGVNVRQVLDYAKGVPCVLLFDELDSLAKRRDDGSDIGELKRLVTVLLQEIDDWPATGILVAATNHPDLLDPAVWRRFDAIINFPMPSEDAAESAALAILRSRGVSDGVARAVAVSLTGLSFSDIERDLMSVCREAAVANEPVEARVLRRIKDRLALLPTAKRVEAGIRLHSRAGFSKRQACELAGIHRDTLTKALSSGLFDTAEGEE